MVHRTASGVFVRDEPHLGMLAYSPFTGMVCGVAREHSEVTLKWLNRESTPNLAPEIVAALGHGWHNQASDPVVLPIPHLLPKREDWPQLAVTQRPILINWFITGHCPLNCLYCYAEDVMRGRQPEPSPEDIRDRAARLLDLSPLVVVLTGGDPLFGGNFRFAVESLAGKVGLLVDTSGYTLNERHIALMQEHRLCVRVSIDAERPRVHNRLRPIYPEYPQLKATLGDSYGRALYAIVRLREAEIPVAVQTVATKKNVNELVSFGDKLASLGVTHWRIFKVSPSNAKMANYRKLVGAEKDSGETVSKRTASDPFTHFFKAVADAAKGRWRGRMSVQLTSNDSPNAIIMLEPSGRFVTESNIRGKGKILIDEEHPEAPRLELLPSRVNMAAHAERYLNNTSVRYW